MDNLAPVMALVEPHKWREVLGYNFVLPDSHRKMSKDDDIHQRSLASASYYINHMLDPSWTAIAESLYHHEQTAALEALMPFLPPKGKHNVHSCIHVVLQYSHSCLLRYWW